MRCLKGTSGFLQFSLAANLLFGIKNELDYAYQVLKPNFETWGENGQGENGGEKTAGEKWLGGNGCKGIKSKVKGYKKEQGLPYS